MINIFRKEMKKWHSVLWVVLASLILSALSMVFFRQKNVTDMNVAMVNNQPVSFRDYRRAFFNLNERFNNIRALAQQYGIDPNIFLRSFLGANSPQELALSSCIDKALLDVVQNKFSFSFDKKWLQQELINNLGQFKNDDGSFNITMYQKYLERISIKPAEFEQSVADERKQSLIKQFISLSSYVPLNNLRDTFIHDHVARGFEFLKIPESIFKNKIDKNSIDDADIEKYFITNQDLYTIPEKRQATYWIFDPTDYASSIMIDEDLAKNFYEKNKSTLYRIAPQIKIKHILIKDKKAATLIYDSCIKNPTMFAELAKKHSEDKVTAENGGIVDFFSKGAHETAFDAAAFRLKNNGDISPLIKTQKGYSIIQLVERKNSIEKPFKTVQSEIIKTLQAKKAIIFIKSDLEGFIRSIGKNNDIQLDDLLKKYTVEQQQTKLYSQFDKIDNSAESLVIKKIFTHDVQHKYGFIQHEGSYILYKSHSLQKSFVPALENIKEQVINDYLREKNSSLAKNTIKDLRASLLSKKTTLQEIADLYNISIVTIEPVKKTDSLKLLKNEDRHLSQELFNLTSKDQILSVVHDSYYYIARISSIGDSDEKEIQKFIHSKLIDENKNEKQKLLTAFIASLHRNAKISIDKTLLQMQNAE